MRKKAFRDLLDRVETWLKEAQEAAFDSLSMIKDEGCLLLTLLILMSLAPAFAYAAAIPQTPTAFCTNGTCTYTPLEPLPGQPAAGQGALTFAQYISNIFTISIVIGSMIAVAVLVVSGITYMMSEALPSKDWGKRKIKQALWALLVLLGSYLILSTINPNLVQFLPGGTIGGNGTKPINPLQPCLYISQAGSAPQTGCTAGAQAQYPSAAQLNQQTQCPGGTWSTNINPPGCISSPAASVNSTPSATNAATQTSPPTPTSITFGSVVVIPVNPGSDSVFNNFHSACSSAGGIVVQEKDSSGNNVLYSNGEAFGYICQN